MTLNMLGGRCGCVGSKVKRSCEDPQGSGVRVYIPSPKDDVK
jgi:hypothetical protein